jgi:hypothetical protein
MYRTLVRQALRLVLVALVVLALSACAGGAKDRAEGAATMKTVVGDGGSQLGDGGPAKSAGFCGPNDVTFYTAGNMYISDGGSIVPVPVATPFARWILMGPSRPWRARARWVSQAMAGLPPRHNSMSPSPWRWTGRETSTSQTRATIGFARWTKTASSPPSLARAREAILVTGALPPPPNS